MLQQPSAKAAVPESTQLLPDDVEHPQPSGRCVPCDYCVRMEAAFDKDAGSRRGTSRYSDDSLRDFMKVASACGKCALISAWQPSRHSSVTGPVFVELHFFARRGLDASLKTFHLPADGEERLHPPGSTGGARASARRPLAAYRVRRFTAPLCWPRSSSKEAL
jgi:hypothetical protein